MKKTAFVLFAVLCSAGIFAGSFKNMEEMAAAASLTIPFSIEKNEWNSNSKTIQKNGVGGELQGRIKPYGLPFGLYAQIDFSQPRTITEKRSGTTFNSKASDYSSIWTTEFQAGTYFLAFKSKEWYVPFGFGLHYKLNYDEVTNIETSSNMFGLGAFVQGELKLTKSLCTFIGANFTYDFAGGSRRESSAGGQTTVYYSESGNLTNLGFTPKMGLLIHNR